MKVDKRKKFKLLRNGKQFLFNSFITCTLFSFFFLYFFKYVLINKSSQDIATTISGTLGTALGFFGSILVYKALREQVKANKLIQKQFEIQVFESRLYKMLDSYNLNVSDLKFIGRKSGNLFEGKRVFSHLINNYNTLKKEIIQFNESKQYKVESITNLDYRKKLVKYKEGIKISSWIVLELSYVIFFYGVGVTGRKNIKSLLSGNYNDDYLIQLLNYLSNKPVEYRNNEDAIENWKKIMLDFENFNFPNNEKFDKFYNGHQSNLGHYYRHLFMIVKYINGQNKLSYLEKWNYSKLLRTQLSNHEQELFFLNSISILGRDWELKNIGSDKEDENEQFITKYDLIRNVSKSVLAKYKIKSFYPNVEYEQEEITARRKYLDEKVYE
ncbi:putative phage abortive infection protein [Flavobacterium pectinovorum]|uniref:putative phage abortive infection protein n=1 Tax=Flavobacterium pectinovorum TaxID=29533 RepID=UPI001FAC3E35|nr:putative phage abortive infection protein [Flavobacterium pectinovorum]MCI9846636.1 putative phage abortive infection protein [Flavobacterium pectinovorum]